MATPSFSAPQSRRRFLNTVGTGSVAAVLASSLGSRLLALDGKPSSFLTSSDPSTELTFMSATKLAQLIREKKVSAIEAVNAYAARIVEVNPKINAVVMMCLERAREEAK